VQKLQDVQKVAEENVKIFKNGRKRPHTYTRNSTRTKNCNAAKHRKLAADPSVQFITNFFTKKETTSFEEKLTNVPIYVSSTDKDEVEVIDASPAALVCTCSHYHEITQSNFTLLLSRICWIIPVIAVRMSQSILRKIPVLIMKVLRC